ncbi:DUF3817 domain-containing protein [Saccharomonospora piscinae]|uniref:DUF3817 domain-containing protein n=1 Tax=Saccharomonospora piscinae TaxID=687388 RepID=A0A1V9A538_SACPI|nr:DUF3817 domain-containing protein [Saccharomonospora piscinae]OQO92193.1 hypothetical protein B1813_08060 [Saccharomonospora piscinae]TLW92120.1 DUF3817 domain-containing protein [Saccharomonospora piscinae]
MSNKAAVLFRVVAIAEAFSWTGLLVGMFLKYVVELGEGGVPVLGMVHGVLFVVYLVTTLAVARPLGWGFGTVVTALLAAIPPLATWWFEKWALRRGKLDGPERLRHGGTGLFAREAVANV